MKNLPLHQVARLFCAAALAFAPGIVLAQTNRETPEIRTPKAPTSPRINGPAVFGVRPGNPFLYHLPATGDRPMTFSVKGLPDGLKLDAATGNITGSLAKAGNYNITFYAKNSKGSAAKNFKIIVGETIALTPPMGWNSWNAYHATV